MRRSLLAPAFVAAVFITSARLDAQQSDSASTAKPLGAVVVTASRRLQRVTDAPVTTEVISRAEIEKSGAQDLNALLTQYVGVQPEPSVAGSGGVQIEGLSSEHVLVLVDGQPLVGRIDGELDLSRVPAWMIDHVEVIKGPLSTLYGSSAMGGVVNVITRDAVLSRPAVTLAATGGTQGRLEANGAVRGSAGDVSGLFGVGRRQDDVQPGRSDQSGARANRWDANGKLKWAPAGSGLSVDGALLGVREDQRWQSGQLYYFSNNVQADGRVGVQSLLNGGSGRAGLTFYYSQFSHTSRQATLPEPVSDSGDVSTESLGRVEATYSGQVRDGQIVDAGIDVDREALSTDRILGQRRTTMSAEPYAQYTMDVGRLSLVPGARLSYSDQWGTHFTPKVAALYRLGGGVALRASVGTGYRAPDFKELYITFLNGSVGYVVHGNPDLTPETSTNVTGGLEWTGSNAYVRVQAYTNRFSSFIESVQEADSGAIEQFTYANIAHGVTRGVDVDAGVALRMLSLDASYGYLEAYDRGAGLPLLGATPRSARLTGDVQLPARVRSSLTVLYWSAAPASQATVGLATTTIYRGAFTRVDGHVSRPFARGVEGQAGVTNLFDTTPRDWPGITERRWYVGVSVDRGL
ncbi:MAG TPA: TonB-dependent receptor [Gemmatimonadaceae bacterium]|jgi:outer membrane receptor for ferrienterochelin and colicins